MDGEKRRDLSVKWTQSESGKYFLDSPSGDYDFALRFSKS